MNASKLTLALAAITALTSFSLQSANAAEVVEIVQPAVITTVVLGPRPDMEIRRTELLMKLDERIANGSLDAAEAADLKSRMGSITAREAAYLADGGILSNEEARDLYLSMDDVGNDLDWFSVDRDRAFLGMRASVTEMFF